MPFRIPMDYKFAGARQCRQGGRNTAAAVATASSATVGKLSVVLQTGWRQHNAIGTATEAGARLRSRYALVAAASAASARRRSVEASVCQVAPVLPGRRIPRQRCLLFRLVKFVQLGHTTVLTRVVSECCSWNSYAGRLRHSRYAPVVQ